MRYKYIFGRVYHIYLDRLNHYRNKIGSLLTAMCLWNRLQPRIGGFQFLYEGDVVTQHVQESYFCPSHPGISQKYELWPSNYQEIAHSGKTGRKNTKKIQLEGAIVQEYSQAEDWGAQCNTKNNFWCCWRPKTGKTARLETLRTLGKVQEPQKQPPLSKHHETNQPKSRVELSHKYMKTDSNS